MSPKAEPAQDDEVVRLRVENAKLAKVVEQANLRAANAEARLGALRKALAEVVGHKRVNQIERGVVR